MDCWTLGNVSQLGLDSRRCSGMFPAHRLVKLGSSATIDIELVDGRNHVSIAYPSATSVNYGKVVFTLFLGNLSTDILLGKTCLTQLKS